MLSRKGGFLKPAKAKQVEHSRKRRDCSRSQSVDTAVALPEHTQTAKIVSGAAEAHLDLFRDESPPKKGGRPAKAFVQASSRLHKELPPSKETNKQSSGIRGRADIRPTAKVEAKSSSKPFTNGQGASKQSSGADSFGEASNCARISADEAAEAGVHRRKRRKITVKVQHLLEGHFQTPSDEGHCLRN